MAHTQKFNLELKIVSCGKIRFLFLEVLAKDYDKN